MSDFDQEQARAAILYTASKVAQPSFHKLSKLFYFADRLHLERFGSLMFCAEYWALRYGPVPMQVYRLMTAVRNNIQLQTDMGFAVEKIDIEGHSAPVVRPLEAPDLDELSDAILECLDESITLYADKSFDELTELSHDSAWQSVESDEVMHIELIAKTLPNAAQVLEHLSDPYP